MITNKITKIEIENIKGFGQDEDSSGNKIPFAFNVDVFPNKPNIVVAPNGFGKSSMTAAFLSLKESKIDLDDNFIHDVRGASRIIPNPLLRLYIDDGSVPSCYEANNNKNEISSNFDVFVVNSRLIPNAKKNTFGGSTKVSPYMGIEKTVLIQTVPSKESFSYSFALEKKSYDSIKKTLKDISFLFHAIPFLKKSIDNDVMAKFSGVKVSKLLSDRMTLIKGYTGTAEQIKNKIISVDLPLLKTDNKIEYLFNLVNEYKHDDWNDGDVILSVYQYIDTFQKMGMTKFKKAIAYEEYLQAKKGFDKILESVNTTRFKISLTEDHRSLVINWPKATEISNGQRDILSFTTSLIEAERKLNAEKNILIIDEIFDYLDDANLLTFQYQIASLIDYYKAQGKMLYPILFTHQDPAAFNHWSFGKKRMHISYLKKVPVKHDVDLLNLVKERENAIIKTKVDKYFFHYHPDSERKGQIALNYEFSRLGISNNISDAFDFYQYIFDECDKYIQGTSINSIAVSFALRVQIEKKVYNLLNVEHKTEFINVHGTDNKLDYAADFLQEEIPEYFYLLGLIYNGILHGKSDEIEQSIGLKLENQTIKKMISDVFEK